MQCNAPALGVELRDMGTKALLLAGVPAVTVQISCIANLFCSAVAALILSKQNRPAHRLQSFEHETLVQLPWFHVAQQPGLHACQAPARRVTIVMRRSQKVDAQGERSAAAPLAGLVAGHLIISRRSHGVRHARANVASRTTAATEGGGRGVMKVKAK